jgi:transcriptional regulator with XRE-family HTH domain
MPERTFGRTIRSRRTKLGLTPAKLGDLVGRSPSTVRSWERDKSQPNDVAVLTALSAVLGVDERILFEKVGLQIPEVEDSPTVEQALATLNPEAVVDAEPEIDDVDDEPVESPPAPELVSVAPAYTAPNEPYVIAPATPPLHEPTYMEDRNQRQLYRVRNLATIVILVALGVAFLWALTQSFDALGTWWDEFFGSLRL